MARELGEPGLGLRAGWAGQRRPVAVRAHLGEVLAAGEGLFGLDLVAEAGVAGPGLALEHLDALVTVLQDAGDGAAGATGDEPGQGTAKLPGGQARLSSPARGDRARPVMGQAVGV
ncbi:hypothetical protein [Streptomyces sp. NPDC000618]|uniref:hypothetical protein n=1 Tax=Streptomyces sp. NPDC000618 TaxID=3154265 RepID=UPI00331895B6